MQKLDKNTAKVVKKAAKIAKEYGVDPSTIDFSFIVDPTLTESENMAQILEKIYLLIPSEEKKMEFREKYLGENVNAEIEKNIKKMEEEVDKHIRKMIKSIKPNKKHPYYQRIKEYITLITNSDKIHLLIINGEGGVGKTHITLGVLNEMGISYEYINGITAFELFDFAQQNNGKVIVLDDITLTPEMIRLLKAMCDTKEGERTVTWISRAKRNSNVSTKFTFTGKIILILNDISLETNEHYSALLSRGYLLNVRLKKSELLSLIRGELGEHYYNMFMKDIQELYKEVPERYVLPLISLRTAIKYKSAIELSRSLSKQVLVDELLERAKDLKLAVENSASKFMEKTGKSKRTWSRYRAIYRYLMNEFVGDMDIDVPQGSQSSAKDVPK